MEEEQEEVQPKEKKGNGKENIHLILLKLKTLPFLGQ